MGIRKVNFRAATGTSNAREVRNQNPFFTSIHTRSRRVQNQVSERKRDFQRHGDYGAATIRRRITLKSCARKTPVKNARARRIGSSITLFPKFLDRPGRENRAHFSYARNQLHSVRRCCAAHSFPGDAGDN